MDVVRESLEVGRAIVGNVAVSVMDVMERRDWQTGGELIDNPMKEFHVALAREAQVAKAVNTYETMLGAAAGLGQREVARSEIDSAELTLTGAGGLTTGPMQRL